MAPQFERAWHELPDAVRTGGPVYGRVHGLGFWDYLTAHPEEGARFDAAMSGGAERARMLIESGKLAGLGTLVDVGGGQGRLLAAALAAVPELRGVLVDRPEVLPGAEPILAAAGVRDRCDLVASDILAAVIHDWPDEQAVTILRACYQAMRPGARLWLIENVLAEGTAGASTHLLDLLMLVLFGAQERTAEEFQAPVQAAGFVEVAVHFGEAPWGLVEGVRP